MSDHEHWYELKIGADEDVVHEPDVISSGVLHIYAECKCGAELDRDEIEHRVNTWEEVNSDAQR